MGMVSTTHRKQSHKVDNRDRNQQIFMKRIFQRISNRLTALALGGAVALAGSAVAFTQKPKADLQPPAVDERPIAASRETVPASRRW